MKVLKIFGGIIGVILLLFALGLLFLPSHAHVERSTMIDAAPSVVYAQLNSMKHFNDWSPWEGIDPNTDYTFEGPEAGVGSKMSWKSDHKDVGSGTQWIVESVPNELVKTELMFEGTDPGTATLAITPEEEGSKVTWALDSELKGHWKFIGLGMDSFIGPMYEKGLGKLKEVVESKPEITYSIAITEEEVAPVKYLGIMESVKMEDAADLSEEMGKLYGELMSYTQKKGIQMAGMPFAVYPRYDETGFDMECALPVAEAIEVEGDRILYKELPGGKVVKGVHMGDYHALEVSHEQVNKYIEDHGLSINGAPREVYVTDPGEVTDTSQWVTHVFYPVGE